MRCYPAPSVWSWRSAEHVCCDVMRHMSGPWYLSVPDGCVEEERQGGGVRAHDKAG